MAKISKATRRAKLLALALVSVVFLWGIITTPTLLGTVPVEFAWEQTSGFRYIRTVGKFASVTDPPFDHILNNPIVVLQAKPRISAILTNAGLRSARGRLDFKVAGCFVVLGVDRLSNNSHVDSPQSTSGKSN